MEEIWHWGVCLMSFSLKLSLYYLDKRQVQAHLGCTIHIITFVQVFLFSSLPGRRLRSDREGDRRSGCWQIQPLQTVTQYIVPGIQILRRNYYVTH